MSSLLNKVKKDSFNIGIHLERTKSYEQYKNATIFGLGFPELYLSFAYDLITVTTTDEVEKEIIKNELPEDIKLREIESLNGKMFMFVGNERTKNYFEDKSVKVFNYGEYLVGKIYSNYTTMTNNLKGLYYQSVQEYVKKKNNGLDEKVMERMVKTFSPLLAKEEEIMDFRLSPTTRFKHLIENPKDIKDAKVSLIYPTEVDGNILDLKKTIENRIEELTYASQILSNRLGNTRKPDIYEEIPETLLTKNNTMLTDDERFKKESDYFTKKDKDVYEELMNILRVIADHISLSVEMETKIFNVQTMNRVEYLSRFRGEYEDLTKFRNKMDYMLSNEYSKIRNSKYITNQKQSTDLSKQETQYNNLLTEINRVLRLEKMKNNYIDYVISNNNLLNKEIYYLYLY